MDAGRARRLIRAHLPLAAETVEPLGTGFHSAAYAVDGAWTVRVTRAADDDLDHERRLLELVARSVAVPVPRPAHVARPGDEPVVLSAYPLLGGEPLTAAALAGLPAPARAMALDGLAGLLADLRAIPSDAARHAGAGERWRPPPTDADGPGPIGPPPIPAALDASLAAAVQAELEAWAAGPEATVDPVLVHGDLKPEHVRHDPATGALTGVLDWGDAQLGHPLHDLAVLGHLVGPDVRDAVAARTPGAAAARVAAVARHVLTVRWLVAIAEFEADGNDEWVRRSVRDLRAHLGA